MLSDTMFKHFKPFLEKFEETFDEEIMYCTEMGGYKTLRKRNVKGKAKGLLDIIVCPCTLILTFLE